MKILLVDDSAAMRKVLKWILREKKIPISELIEASCSEESLRIIESHNPDIVISDWNMPNMGGLELLKSLRDANNSITFGFVVNNASEKIKTIAKYSGANFIIDNPGNYFELNSTDNNFL